MGRFPHRHLFHFLFLAAPLSSDPMIRGIKRWMLSSGGRDGADGGRQQELLGSTMWGRSPFRNGRYKARLLDGLGKDVRSASDWCKRSVAVVARITETADARRVSYEAPQLNKNFLHFVAVNGHHFSFVLVVLGSYLVRGRGRRVPLCPIQSKWKSAEQCSLWGLGWIRRRTTNDAAR